VVEFVSVYAQHLLIEAAERNHAIPADLTAAGNQYLRALAERDGNSLTEERQSAYAIYLLSRQGQRMAAQVAAARKRLQARYRDEWQQDLTAAWLAAALELMRQERDAEQLIGAVRFDQAASEETYNDAMTRDALLLFVVAKHFPERLNKLPSSVLQTMAQRIDTGSYHSLSAGTSLLALDAYTNATQANQTQLAISEVLKNKNTRALSLPSGLFPQVAFTPDATALRFANDAELSAFYLVEQTGFDRTAPTQLIKQGLEVLREYTDANGKALQTIKMGEQVDVHLKFRAVGAQSIDSIALVDLLPGGFELVVPNASTNEYEEDGYGGWQCQICVGDAKASLEYADLREDRVVFHASATGDLSEIVYRIKATNIGTYVVPPAYGEALYRPGVIARSVAGRLVVERP
jgi:uncharacterized protein YfaS (alpha-2-macroglobulin family)